MQPNKTILAIPLALLAVSAVALFGDEHDKKTDVTISEPVQVPGGIVLSPGTYMFILNNSASSRNIVEIKSEDGKQLYAMMFTTRAARVNRTDNAVLTFYEMPAGQPQAVRQWFWPGDYDGQEFLYPHNQAVKIDQSANEKVPEATDKEYADLQNRGFSTEYPASSSDASAATQQSSTVTQQSFASKDATVNGPAVQDQAAVSQTAPSNSNQKDQSQLSQNSQPDTSAAQANATQTTQSDTQQYPTLAQNNPPASTSAATPAPSKDTNNAPNAGQNTSLPQTGSDFPAIGMLGLFLLTAGATLHLARRSA